MQIHRRAVKETVGDRIKTVLCKTRCHLIRGQPFEAIAFTPQLPHLKHCTIEQAHKHVGRSFALGLGHALLNKRGNRLKPLCAKGFQGTARRLGELAAKQIGRVFGQHLARQIGTRALVQRGVEHGGTQAHELLERTIGINRQTQIAERFVRVFAHAGQQHLAAVEQHRQHVVVKLARLTLCITQLVGD